MVIYLITNIVNRKIYVGQTRRALAKRRASYKSNVRCASPSAHVIVRAMRKHGFENFTFNVLETCQSLDELNAREIYWIAALNATTPTIGYNVSPGGFAGLSDPVLVEKRVAPLRGRKHSEEWKKRISEGLLGHVVSAETRALQSEAKKGRTNWRKGQRNWDVRVCACSCGETFECAPAKVKRFKDRQHSKR